MKTNAPDKIYVQPNAHDGWFESNPHSNIFVEYTRTDAFVEKACEFLKDHMAGYDICEDDIERSVESFKLAMRLWN